MFLCHIVRGVGGGESPHPPPMCSIHLDDATAAILRQSAHLQSMWVKHQSLTAKANAPLMLRSLSPVNQIPLRSHTDFIFFPVYNEIIE